MPYEDTPETGRRGNPEQVVASFDDVESSSRFGLVRRSPGFGLLFLATAGSGFGTYIAAVALTLHIERLTGSGVWVAALLIADFLPIVVIGLLLGPLVDRLSRRKLMVVSDLARVGVFVALPFVNSPEALVGLAGVAGIATGFFRPAVYAGLPNLVPDDELTNANSLLQTIETVAWMIGPIVGGLMFAVWGPDVPYAFNAVTFLVSAGLVAAIPERSLRSEESLTRGHWRDVADGLRLVVTSAPLRTVLVVWNIVLIGSAAINVAEVFYAKDSLGAGDVGFGIIVAASGVGLAFGSYLAAPALGKVGLRRHYAGSIALVGVGWGAAALAPSLYVAVPLIIAASAGNGAALICNQILVQRGAPDRYRGRALATIMSSNYALLGLAMAGAGFLTEAYGARVVWVIAGVIFLFASVVTLAMTRWLPVGADDDVLEAHARAAASALVSPEPTPEPVAAPAPPPPALPQVPEVLLPEPEPAPALPALAAVPRDGTARTSLDRIAALMGSTTERTPAVEAHADRQPDGAAKSSLERIASVLEEAERRREAESGRRNAS
jgi:MFS family permease